MMTPEPVDGLPGVPAAQVLYQVDCSAATLASMPVIEFGAGDRKRTTRGLPARLVSLITYRAPGRQDDFQGDFPNRVGLPPEVVWCHCSYSHDGRDGDGPWHDRHLSIRPRRLSQSRMLITWLLEVSRSLKAAVNWGFFRKDPQSPKPRLEVMIVVFRRCRLCISVKN